MVDIVNGVSHVINCNVVGKLSDEYIVKNLGAAIIIQAMQDHQSAKRSLEHCNGKCRTRRLKEMLEETEKFIRSDLCYALCDIPAEMLMAKIDTVDFGVEI